ncbi:hypothetical protein GALMADRAFT_244175 [Galerina marginata CBS 339.88]|uniref:DUF6534 domain-containing protein n=1 Tax=Galerina marginata (strain CBS 339.88) TaxID=685588 RepID=A0A067T654_GALM3|nr:hypothetical protein GALMADRAFT_244175 [Galerina marginata CBS 339.88]
MSRIQVNVYVNRQKYHSTHRNSRFLDTFHLALITHALYFYLITSYANPLALLFPTWSILSQVYVTCISDLVVRLIYARRVWMISRNMFIAFLVVLTSAVALGTGIAFTTLAFIGKTYASLTHISYLMYIALGGAVAADIIIASALCTSLARSRTGFKKTDSMVTVLMLYAINSSVLTTVCSAACFITYTIWPDQFTFIGIYFCLSKLIFNSLLAMLNSRSSLKRMVNGLSTNDRTSARPAEFSSSWVSKGTYQMQDGPRSPVVISVDTHVETRAVV